MKMAKQKQNVLEVSSILTYITYELKNYIF